jgi:predicted nucleic acid-binding protein
MRKTAQPKMEILVDTSGWADAVLKNTADHAAMEAFYKQCIAQKRPLITSNYILAEVVALLQARSRASREAILRLVRRIKQLAHIDIIYIDRSIDDAAWEMLEQYRDKEWSLTDATSFVIMQRRGIQEAFTSDHHFEQAGFVCMPPRKT